MGSPNRCRRSWRRVSGFAAVGVALGGVSLAQPPARGPAPVVVAPSKAGRPLVLTAAPLGPFTNLGVGARSYDPCLVRPAPIDPRFVVPARPTDDAMAVPSPVAGLYRGTLAPRR